MSKPAPPAAKPAQRCCCLTPCFLVPLSLFFLALGLLLMLFLPHLVHDKVNSMLSLDNPTTLLYEGFRNQSSKVRVVFAYTFFNVTNYEAVEREAATPVLTQLGPYAMERVKWRDESELYFDANSVLHYKTRYVFRFVPELSAPGVSLSDTVFQPRAGLFLGLQLLYSRRDGFEDWVYDELLKLDKITTLFRRFNVSELLFGYVEPFLAPVAALGLHSDVVAFCANHDSPADVKWSAVYTGGEASESWTVNDTVAADTDFNVAFPREIGQYVEWEGQTKLKYWLTDFANTIRGSDGSIFPKNLFDRDTLDVFVDNLHRSLLGRFADNQDFHGITLRRYELDNASLSGADTNPLNAGFCMFSGKGLIPIPPIPKVNCSKEKIRAALGMPFFYNADMRDVRVVLPRAPSKALDESFLDIEPYTGIPLRVRNQLQANVMLEPVTFEFITKAPHSIKPFRNLPTTWLPRMTASEQYEMPHDLRERIRLEIMLPHRLAEIAGPVFVTAGGAVLVAVALLEIFKSRANK